MIIDSFSGRYRFLSNFAPAAVALDSIYYASVEHAYQAAKTYNGHQRASILTCGSAAEAKKLGKRFFLRYDWERVKEDVMLDLLRQKFVPVTHYRALLQSTGDKMLVEGNTWGDRYWGVCNGAGHNRLGVLLMQVRSEL